MTPQSPLPSRVHRPTPWYESGWKIAGRILSNTLLIGALLLVIMLVVVPKFTGGMSLTVLSGSMQPGLQPGDIIVTRGLNADTACSEVSIGNVVTFLPLPDDPTLVTHRVIDKTIGTFDDGTTCRFTTQGDANSAADEPISPKQLRGAFLFKIPMIGWIQNWLGGSGGLALGIVAALIISYGVWQILRKPKASNAPSQADNHEESSFQPDNRS